MVADEYDDNDEDDDALMTGHGKNHSITALYDEI